MSYTGANSMDTYYTSTFIDDVNLSNDTSLTDLLNNEGIIDDQSITIFIKNEISE